MRPCRPLEAAAVRKYNLGMKGSFLFTGQKEQIKRNPQTERGDNPKMRARASPKMGVNLNRAYSNNSN